MAAWQCALDTIDGELIPTYYFARDDRVYKAFTDRLDQHKQAVSRTCTRRLRWQMRVLRAVMEGRSTTYSVSVACTHDWMHTDILVPLAQSSNVSGGVRPGPWSLSYA